MGESLIISETMNLGELADRMGGATRDEAMRMRWVLCNNGFTGKTTTEVPEADWLIMCDKAVELAAE